MKDAKKINRNGKSEQKNKIVRNIFLNVSKSDGGAKGKGQVMIVDHSEDSLKPILNSSKEFSQISNINTDNRLLNPIPIICKIDLSRLTRIPGVPIYQLNHNDLQSNGVHAERGTLLKVFHIFQIFIFSKLSLKNNNKFLLFSE